jgi:hypothetical protein
VANSIQLELPDQALEQLRQLMLATAQEAFETVSTQKSLPQYMNAKEASLYMGVAPATFRGFVKQGLAACIVGGVTRYNKKDCDNFYNAHKI